MYSEDKSIKTLPINTILMHGYGKRNKFFKNQILGPVEQRFTLGDLHFLQNGPQRTGNSIGISGIQTVSGLLKFRKGADDFKDILILIPKFLTLNE